MKSVYIFLSLLCGSNRIFSHCCSLKVWCNICREERGQTVSSDGLEQPPVDTVESLYQQLEKEKEEQRRLLQEQLEKEKEEQRRLLQEQLEKEKEEQRKLLMEQLEKEKEEQRRKLQEQKEVAACSLNSCCLALCPLAACESFTVTRIKMKFCCLVSHPPEAVAAYISVHTHTHTVV